MKKLYRSFLEENLSLGYSNEKFDYDFFKDCNNEKYNEEYKKFLGMYNSVFYSKNRLVTIFNSYEIRVKKKDLIYLIELYIYSSSNNLKEQQIILEDFLVTYNNSINSKEYKENYKQHDDAIKDFNEVLEKFDLRKEFFTSFRNDIYEFYKNLIKYGIKNDIFIDSEIINKIFNNLSFNLNYCNEMIEIFIQNKKNLCNIIYFDKKIKKHLEYYVNYIIDSLNVYGGYNYAKEVLFELDKASCLNDIIIKKVLNSYIKLVNDLCEKTKFKNYNFISGISEIENLRKELLYILNVLSSLSKEHKSKIKNCLLQLLRLKRYLISDENYVNSDMHESSFEQKIPSSEIDKFRKSLLNNKFALYNASKIRFTNDIATALESYSNHPLLSLVSNYKIDSSRQVYFLNIEDRNKKSNDNFKKYFDEKGRIYTENHPKLVNKIYKDYYEELLKYVSKTFGLQQHLLLSTIGLDNFNKIIDELKDSVGYKFNNKYAMVVSNILSIEVNVAKILSKHDIEYTEDGFENLNNLFKLYEKEDDTIIDGLMYLNYTLYEKSGFNLRNSAMHGTLINENLDIPLIASFSGLIFISWLLTYGK